MSQKNQDSTPKSLQGIGGQPETAEELITKYGTYEIQPTSDSGHIFPTIAAGLPAELKEKKIDKRNKPFSTGHSNNKTM